MTRLADRRVLAVAGPDREGFLDGLLSCRTVGLEPGALVYGALLTPQGKVVTDVFVHARADALLLDVPADAADDLARRLAIYRLRAAVEIAPSDEVVWLGDGPPDPRAEGLGTRTVRPAGEASDGDNAAYDAARLAAGVPDAGSDFVLGEAFPHDANMDLTGGVDFTKGCFVGQEVVSRMRHRGTARRRTVRVEAGETLPATGTDIVTAAGVPVGRLGTVVGDRGLAMVRIDRVDGTESAAGIALRLVPPPGAPFRLSGSADAKPASGEAGGASA